VVPPSPPQLTDRVIIERILALDPEHVTDADVRRLARGPTPRIMLLHGGIYPVHLSMESFGRFLVGMGIRKRGSAIPMTAAGRIAPTRTPSAWPASPRGTTKRRHAADAHRSQPGRDAGDRSCMY
jgi:hypothetical protein